MADSIIGSALKGIRSGFSQVAQAADRISRAFTGSESDDSDTFVDDTIQLHQGARQVQASAKVVKVSEELDKAELDLLA